MQSQVQVHQPVQMFNKSCSKVFTKLNFKFSPSFPWSWSWKKIQSSLYLDFPDTSPFLNLCIWLHYKSFQLDIISEKIKGFFMKNKDFYQQCNFKNAKYIFIPYLTHLYYELVEKWFGFILILKGKSLSFLSNLGN